MKRLSILFTLVFVCCTWPVSAQQPIGNNSLHVMPLAPSSQMPQSTRARRSLFEGCIDW